MFMCWLASASPLVRRLPAVQVSAPLGLDVLDIRALSVQLHADDRPQSKWIQGHERDRGARWGRLGEGIVVCAMELVACGGTGVGWW